MARATQLANGQLAVVRSVTALLAADSATLTDANILPADGIDCTKLDTIFVGPEITGGTNPTMTIEALFRDPDAPDGQRWKRLYLGAAPGVTATALANETTGALQTGLGFAELRVYGWPLVYLRVTAVGAPTSTTAWKILAFPGQRRP